MATEAIEISSQNRITSLCFEPNRAYFVTGDDCGSLRQWSVADSGVHDSLWTTNTNSPINAVVVSPDGRWIISSGSENKAIVWSTETRDNVLEIAERTGPTTNKTRVGEDGYQVSARENPYATKVASICTLDISSDSTRFAFGSQDNTVWIFDIISGRSLIPPLQCSNTISGIKFSPDASQIAVILRSSSSHPSIEIYDTSSRALKSQFNVSVSYKRPISAPAWSSDGQQVFVASPGKITCFNTFTSSSLEWAIHGKNDQGVSIVTSGQFIACSTGSSLSFWDYVSRKRIGQIISHTTNISFIAISHDGRRLACGHSGGITLHNLEGFIPGDYLPGILWLPLMRVSAAALKSWVRGTPAETEAILSDEIMRCSNSTYEALAISALIQMHLGECKTALETADKSLQIKQSPIGQIARFIALVGTGSQEDALKELDLVFCGCNPSDIKLLLVINSILLFVRNNHREAISRLRRFIDGCDEKMKDTYLQVLGMMYLKQGDYVNAVETLCLVKNPFTAEDRGPLMTIFIIFNWNFEDQKFVAWQRACEKLYVGRCLQEVRDTLLKMIGSLPEDERELAHTRALQEIINRSGEVTLLAWAGKSSTYNSCLPSSPATYAQTSTIPPFPTLEGEDLRKRTAELRSEFSPVDALMTYASIIRSQPVRFAHFHIHLPCIVFGVKTLRKEKAKVYHAETVGLGEVEFTTVDLLAPNQPQKLVFVNPWIHHLQESCGMRSIRAEDGQGSDMKLNADTDIDVELVHGLIVEEAPTPPSRTLDTDVHTRALELIARLGQPFTALLLLKQSDGTYKRVAAEHEIGFRGIEDNVLKNMHVEVLEVV